MSKVQPPVGLLGVVKPSGITSKDVSRWFSKNLKIKDMGHVGTLDPLASGVLPLLFGVATRLQDYLLDSPKEYICKVKMGYETDTLDAMGESVKQMDSAHVQEEHLRRAMGAFLGEISQVPPIYSAVKLRGKPLYSYAHKGQEGQVALESLSRRVRIESIDLLSFEGDEFVFKARCSKGTYIRVLAKDICEALGTVGTVVELERTLSAGLDLDQCITYEQLAQNVSNLNDLAKIVQPISQIHLPLSVIGGLSEAEVKRLFQGQGVLQKREGLTLSLDAPAVVLKAMNGMVVGLGRVSNDHRTTQDNIEIRLIRSLLS